MNKKRTKQPIFDDPNRYVPYAPFESQHVLSKFESETKIRGAQAVHNDWVLTLKLTHANDQMGFTYDPYDYVGFRIVRNK